MRKIKINNIWYKDGENFESNENFTIKIPFLFYLKTPIKYKKQYTIDFIGCDCSALVHDSKGNYKTIVGSVLEDFVCVNHNPVFDEYYNNTILK